jgi:hypothetical protein
MLINKSPSLPDSAIWSLNIVSCKIPLVNKINASNPVIKKVEAPLAGYL